MSFFTSLAMALDTLPLEGRVMLLAALLTGALCGFARVLPVEAGSSLQILYRKGALLALVLVPALVYVLEVKVPVPVEEVTRFDTPIPRYVAFGLLAVWGCGLLWHLLVLLKDLRTTYGQVKSGEPAPQKMAARAAHWRSRLNLKTPVQVHCGGAEPGWHAASLFARKRRPAFVHLPAAALNWPVGVVDALLLIQLAKLSQGAWNWLVFGRLVQAIYWPTPWVATLVQDLAESLARPGLRLAAAAYRDPEGWRRDLRQLSGRASTLTPIDAPGPGRHVRLADPGEWSMEEAKERAVDQDDSFESKWRGTKRRRRDKHRDPYEQAYWLIAVASIAVGIATTLTLVKAPPEFEPRFLNIKWHDQMVRRIRDFYGEDDEDGEDEARPPRTLSKPREVER